MNNLDAVDKALDSSKRANINMFETYSNTRTRGHQFKIKIKQTYFKTFKLYQYGTVYQVMLY